MPWVLRLSEPPDDKPPFKSELASPKSSDLDQRTLRSSPDSSLELGSPRSSKTSLDWRHFIDASVLSKFEQLAAPDAQDPPSAQISL